MKSICSRFLYIVSILGILGSVFLSMGFLLQLIFPITVFQGAMVLLVLFCLGAIVFSLNDISARLGYLMDEEDDYFDWDDTNYKSSKSKEASKVKNNKRQNGKKNNKIIIMKSSINDKDVPCPCGSGKKYKNCCGKKHLEKE